MDEQLKLMRDLLFSSTNMTAMTSRENLQLISPLSQVIKSKHEFFFHLDTQILVSRLSYSFPSCFVSLKLHPVGAGMRFSVLYDKSNQWPIFVFYACALKLS